MVGAVVGQAAQQGIEPGAAGHIPRGGELSQALGQGAGAAPRVVPQPVVFHQAAVLHDPASTRSNTSQPNM